jgi:hypothetical protein
MPAYARRQIVDESHVGVYHCASRCVRREFLCGDDRFTGKNFDHRKVWSKSGWSADARRFNHDIRRSRCGRDLCVSD